ncbi:MAG: carbohydrate-binding protein [Ferruginibacter sp.]
MKFLPLVVSLLISGTAKASNYYFSSSAGDDSRTASQAKSPSTPWKTITKLNSIFSTLNPGDSILFSRGDVFPGTIIVNKSGSSTARIVLGAYGTGNKPVISGFSTLADWTNLGGNIWESTADMSGVSNCAVVLINGNNTPMGRTPNSGYWIISSATNNSITDNTNGHLNNIDLTGAEIASRTARWHLDRAFITSTSGNTVYFSGMSYPPGAGWGYFIQNHESTLDTQNEWYFNPSTKKLKIYSSSNPGDVQVATLDAGASLNNKDYICFDNLDFRGFNKNGIDISSRTGIIVQNCDISYAGVNGIYCYPNAPGVRITGCSFKEINSNGIFAASSSNAYIAGNTLFNIGNIAGMGESGDLSYTGIISHGDNGQVMYNNVQNCGYIGIRWDGHGALVHGNFVNNTNYVKDDGGGIYTYPWPYGVSGSTVYQQRTVSNNIVLNTKGTMEGGTPSSNFNEAMGIYNDGTAPNTNYINNSVANAYFGIFSNAGHDNTISGNTVYNCVRGLHYNNYGGYGIENLTVTNNTFVAATAGGNCGTGQYAAFFDPGASGMPASFTASNNVYARPLDEVNGWIWRNFSGSSCNTLAQWQSLTGQDAGSTKSPLSVSNPNDLRFEYNETAQAKTILLGATYIDMKGEQYSSTVTLEPYTSIVLIKTSSTNVPPVANAGQDIAINLPVNSATLTGSGTDPDGTIASYLWRKISGPTNGSINNTSAGTTTVVGLSQGTYQFELKVTDNSGASDLDTMQVTVTGQLINTPYGGTAHIIPGTIQLEDYDNGGQNIAYFDNTTENLGSFYRTDESVDIETSTEGNANIGWTEAGEWMKYTVHVNSTGNYTLLARVSSQNIATAFRVEMDGITIATIDVPNTGGFQSWQSVIIPNIPLTAGDKVMRVYYITGGYNLNYISFSLTVNQLPSANAGTDQNITLPTNSVSLNGSGTDPDGTITAYLWRKIAGPASGIITNSMAATTTVTGLSQGTYTFELKVTDNSGASDLDTMQVTVNAAPVVNQLPTANAGIDQTITLPTNSVSLNGSGTDSDGTITAYLWRKIAGPTSGIITNSNAAATSVTGLSQGVYQFELKVTDNSGASDLDTMQVTVNAAPVVNQLPTANAGVNQTITLPTNSVSLNGGGTDPDGTITAYLWRKISGPASGNITNITAATTTVTGLSQGVYQFELKVTDNSGASDLDTMQVTVNAAPVVNQLPTANAGLDQNIMLPTSTASLNGSGTDPDGTITTYLWRKISGPASGNITNSNAATTTVTGLSQGTYKFELKVTDNSGATDLDTMQVTVNPAMNQVPSANAGVDQVITLPVSSATLSGTGTDPDGNIIAYLWRKISGPAGGSITSITSATTSTTGLTEGVYQFELRVTDNSNAIDADTMTITVNPAVQIPNELPFVNAGVDTVIYIPDNTITLTGSGHDNDGAIVSYEWNVISGGAYHLFNGNTQVATLSDLEMGVYEVELTVTDNRGGTATDNVRITVGAGRQQVNEDNDIIILGNPVGQTLTSRIISSNSIGQPVTLILFSANGSVILQKKITLNTSEQIEKINTAALQPGTYFLKAIFNGEKQVVKKVVKI